MPPKKRKAVDDPYPPWTPSASPMFSQPYSSSYGATPMDPAPKPKRQRKAKGPDATAPEKRGAMFKKACPKNILERVERVMSQRFYMIERRREGDALREEFSVLGSTGNVYTVVIDKKPSCNCPDALKGNHCKHILFIFLKVLQVSQQTNYWYQKALLTSELEDVFAYAPLAPAAVSHQRIRDAYAQATGKNVASSSSSESQKKKRLPGEEDDCPICYENIHGADEKSLVFCEECGNGLHKECFQQWAKAATKKGDSVTCVFCRAKWIVPTIAGPTGAQIAEGYLNLGDAVGLSPVRDTSSYYQGPSRGRRFYGYRECNDYF